MSSEEKSVEVITESTVEIKVEDGYMVECPHWETHSRGTNFCAIIGKSPESPGGLSRSFLEKGHGHYYYSVDGLKVNMPLELAADYTSSGGRRSRRRYFYNVVSIAAGKITLVERDTALEAIRFYEDSRENGSSNRATLAMIQHYVSQFENAGEFEIIEKG